MDTLRALYFAFFRIGALTFGGGYSMLPMLEREVVEKHAWATSEELLDYFAIGQCTPGIIAVNTATLIGYKRRGALGALAATAGVVTPSIIIITIIAALLSGVMDHPVVMQAFAGIRVAVAALIASAVVRLFKSNVLAPASSNEGAAETEKSAAGRQGRLRVFFARNAVSLLLCVGAFVVVAILGASPVYVVVGACVFGILFYRNKEA
ncbi:chromate transporter [Christensenellaceae bacterium OttesenSCG-928-L17]|nr:chromate transporter [Christensenellaceae bacterium OttesenSCG-928-L17]